MKKLFTFILILLAVTCVPVYAKIENFRAGNSVSFTEDTTATTFIAGNVVDVKSRINGIGFIAGNHVTVSGSEDYLFAAGNSVNVNNNYKRYVFSR